MKDTKNIDTEQLVVPDADITSGGEDVLEMEGGDLTEQIAAEMGVEKTVVETTTPAPDKNDITSQLYEEMKSAKESETTVVTESEARELKEILAESFKSKGLELPEGLNDENWVDEIVKVLADKTSKSLHPMVRDIQDAISRGIDPEDLIMDYAASKSNFLNRAPEDIVRESLTKDFGVSDKRPKGWSEEKINGLIENMKKSGIIDIEAEKIKLMSEKESQSTMKQKISERELQNLKTRQEIEKVQADRINAVIKKSETWDNIWGIEFGQAEKAQFAKEFPALVRPDPKTGKVWIEEELSNDETLAEVVFYLRNKGAIKSTITKAKESAKRNLIEKLDTSPRLAKKSGDVGNTLEPDYDALASPEKITIAKNKK
jgi:hypothetical protein